jgi:hypothetical protein
LDVVDIIKRHTQYVIVSGYVSILFGRTRTTEDIDMVIPTMAFSVFEALARDLKSNGFYFLNSDNVRDLYDTYLTKQIAIRIGRKVAVPNMEVKFPKIALEQEALDKAITVRFDEHELRMSPLELQIAFKFFLGSDKDIEDAVHLYEIFKENLNREKILLYCKRLEIDGSRWI